MSDRDEWEIEFAEWKITPTQDRNGIVMAKGWRSVTAQSWSNKIVLERHVQAIIDRDGEKLTEAIRKMEEVCKLLETIHHDQDYDGGSWTYIGNAHSVDKNIRRHFMDWVVEEIVSRAVMTAYYPEEDPFSRKEVAYDFRNWRPSPDPVPQVPKAKVPVTPSHLKDPNFQSCLKFE